MAYKKFSFVDLFYVTLGALILAFSLGCFTAPNKIATAGLNGVATVLFSAAKIPMGLTILTGNFFLIILQAKLIGLGPVWKTIYSILITSFSVELFLKIPPLTTDHFLACLYGGLLGGIGVGLTFKAGGTTGGTDIISQILYKRYHIPVGDVMLISNIGVMLFAGFVFGPELALFGLIQVVLSGKVVDSVLEGMSVNRTAMIISKHGDEIGWAIIERLQRGVTSLEGYGVYTNKGTKILLSAIHRHEVPRLRQIIYQYDPEAFIIIGDARQVIGKGFVDLDVQMRREKDL